MLKPDWTREELLDYLGMSADQAQGMHTKREWQDMLGLSPAAITRVLESAKERGVLRMQRIRREALDGRNALVPTYGFDLGG